MIGGVLGPDEIIRRAHAVGAYYGFVPLSVLAARKRGSSSRAPYPEGLALDTLDETAREVASFLKQVRNTGYAPSVQNPLFVWHTNAAAGRLAPREIVIQFHALGIERPIADAVLIRAIRALVWDIGKTEPALRVNSMGDKETRGRFGRELSQFFKKNDATLPPECTECAKRDLFKAAKMLADKKVVEHMPSPTDHLSEGSRKHFESLLEYLEATDTPYELAPDLLSHGSAWAETCFHIRAGTIEAWGSRYADLARFFFKEHVPSIGAVIRIARVRRVIIPSLKERTRPRFIFVHIGDEAKRESMKLADELRRARVSLTQAIGIESLTEQMRLAEAANPPYLIIMGRKEAMEGSVILRERATHAEDLIPLSQLIVRLKKVA